MIQSSDIRILNKPEFHSSMLGNISLLMGNPGNTLRSTLSLLRDIRFYVKFSEYFSIGIFLHR